MKSDRGRSRRPDVLKRDQFIPNRLGIPQTVRQLSALPAASFILTRERPRDAAGAQAGCNCNRNLLA